MIAALDARTGTDQLGAAKRSPNHEGEHDGQAHVVGEEAQQGTQGERTAVLFFHQGYRYTVVVAITSGIQGVEAELWYVPPGDNTKTPG